MFYRNAGLATSDQEPYRYVRSANGTESWTPRRPAGSGYSDSELRSREMSSNFPGTCRACGQRFPAGERIWWSKANGAKHVECPKVPNTDTGIIAAQADALLNEYDATRAKAEPVGHGGKVFLHNGQYLPANYRPIPEGRYTVRPADETVASVLSIEAPTFGNFTEGSRAVSMHGQFGERSWYGFAIVRPDGRISLYKTARAVMDAETAGSADEQHLRAKLRAAVKAVRLMIDAGTSDLLEYGKAYAASEGHCFVCRRPLLDETSQKLGIGPVCLKRFA